MYFNHISQALSINTYAKMDYLLLFHKNFAIVVILSHIIFKIHLIIFVLFLNLLVFSIIFIISIPLINFQSFILTHNQTYFC